MQEKSRQSRYRYYLTYLLWYSILFAVVTAGVFLVYIVNDRSLVWESDAVSQYVPKAAYFGKEMREIFANFLQGNFNIPLYDFALGMGDTVPFHFEPLYWLFILFGAAEIENAFELVLLVRFYLAGLSMSVFLLYFKNTRGAALAGSFAYIYCEYGLYACLRHTQFVVPMIMLPLAILCMEEIYRKKRWYLCTVLVWIHLWCGYYFLYMDTLAMGVYFLIRFFTNKEGRTFKEFWLRMRTIVCSYLLGVAIGNITLVNSFAAYLTSSRSVTEAGEIEKQVNYLSYGLTWPLKFFRSFMTAGRGPGNWLRLGFIPLIFIGLAVLFLKKGKKSLKAAVITGTVFCMIPAVGFVFSGFGNINNRWSYIYSFALAAVLSFVWKDILLLTQKQWRTVALFCLPSLAVFGYEMLTGNQKARTITAVSAMVMLVSLAVLYLIAAKPGMKLRFKSFALVAVTVFSLGCYGYETYSHQAGNVASEFRKNGEVYGRITEMPLAAMEEVEDSSFYRAATNVDHRSVQGAAQILDYNGIVYYTSTTSKIMQDFYKQLGISSWSLVRLIGFDQRAFVDALASVKYYCLEEGKEQYLPFGYKEIMRVKKEGKPYTVYENELALPIGYTYDRIISEEELNTYDMAARQEVLMQAAVLEVPEEQKSMSDFSNEEISVTGQVIIPSEMELQNIELGENQIIATGKKKEISSMTLKFDGLENSEVYLYIKGLRSDKSANTNFTYQCGANKYTYGLHGAQNTYYTGQEDYLFNLGYHEEKTDTCTITFENGAKLAYEEILIYCQPMEPMKGYADARKETVLENVEVLTNEVKGTISLDRDKLLVLSIPYEGGWTAYIDGKEAEILKANLMYMALPLTEGEHTIELHYTIPGLDISLMISAAGIAILIIALIVRRKRKNAS